ncbi:hypothetical protein HN814_02915, partial [Candidatus Woesearchaeota archaeon]|nr:hypothetical protein [Candidatus Woesearchaeota archaeon]
MNETNKKNLLETIIEDIPNTKSTVFFPPNLNPHVNENYFDIARRAVEVIESPGEIQQFVKEFVQHIQIKYSLDEKIAKQEMNKTIGYCTGYVDDDQANIWFYALPDIKHPITGRERPFNKAKNSQGYLLTIETGTEKIKKYV